MIARPPWGGLSAETAGAPWLAVLGVPWDGGVGWRPGAAEAPRRLRQISHTSPAIAEDGFVVDPARFPLRDLGDLGPQVEEDVLHYFGRVEQAAREAMAAPGAPFLLSIGGDHSVLIPLFRAFAAAQAGTLGLVLLDAHPDLFDEYDGSRTSHACPIRRALESGRLAPEHLLILGTRSYNGVELDFMRANGVRFVPARELERQGAAGAVALARERLSGCASVYLTIDIDVADPAFAPGTGAPVAGGLTSRQLLDLVRGLVEELPVRAADLVEVSPRLDPTDATLFLALQVVFETIAALARKAR
ncbi:MAG TPA: arginase family protein [Vicinamibacteria bacterium]|nr:arginase family protein [Vicinamibacteria bacterium]